mgnify:CR=1 FL=1
MAILLEIESTLPATLVDNDPSKDSIERTSIFFPKEMPFLSKYCKKSEDESSTPIQTPHDSLLHGHVSSGQPYITQNQTHTHNGT